MAGSSRARSTRCFAVRNLLHARKQPRHHTALVSKELLLLPRASGPWRTRALLSLPPLSGFFRQEKSLSRASSWELHLFGLLVVPSASGGGIDPGRAGRVLAEALFLQVAGLAALAPWAQETAPEFGLKPERIFRDEVLHTH